MVDIKLCETCYFWSDQIAQSSGGVIHAMCLSESSINNQRFTDALNCCAQWRDGSNGVIDEKCAS